VLASLQASAAAGGTGSGAGIALLDASFLAPDVAFVDEYGTTVSGAAAAQHALQASARIAL
jgi:hypothetical protein